MPTHIEVRPGEGGDDARAFAQELAASITAYLKRHGHSPAQQTDDSRTITITTSAAAADVERVAGTHRVQRIPAGAAARHTSTATVAVLCDDPSTRKRRPELGGRLRVDRYRGSGPGGQHRNKVSTAVRLVHEASGITITRESGRSQKANLDSAMRELKHRLASQQDAAADQAKQRQRATQITPDREAKAFTHNHQRGEVVDHQTGQRWTLKAWAKGRI